jgi:prolyl 4-hydroxylase
VSVVIHFSPDLSGWLTDRLDRGEDPARLVASMIEERMDRGVATAIVGAFLDARRTKRAAPTDSVVVEEDSLGYVEQASRLPSGTRIETFDRVVRVAARAERPVLAVLHDVLAPEECRELIELARPRLSPSTVVEPSTGRDVVAPYRNSFGMFFRPAETSLIRRLEQRMSEVMGLPVENGEGFQVLHYPVGGESTPHFDFLRPTNEANRASIARSGQRVSSLVAYLNDVESGGETFFPAAGWTVSPACGHAVYFEYSNRLGQVDERSLHGANAVLRGEKWVLTKWMRERRFVSAGSESLESVS